MSLFSDLLSTPIRILNIPARSLELLVDPDSESGDNDNILSKPLETIATAIDEIGKTK